MLDLTTLDPTTRRSFKPRGAFGLDYVTPHHYVTSDHRGGIEKSRDGWDGYRDEQWRAFASMKDAARFARRG